MNLVQSPTTILKPNYIKSATLLAGGLELIIAYVDESGDTGNSRGRSSATYTLGCVMVRDKTWSRSFDELISLRRRLKNSYGIPVRSEIKANFLIRNSGPFKDLQLPAGQRKLIYRAHLDQISHDPNISAFAIVVHKSMAVPSKEVFNEAWTLLFQRLERTSRSANNEPVLIIHDEGENLSIRKLARWSRRRLSAGSMSGGASRSVPFITLVDDSVPRASHESYFLQLADLVAYAAFRRVYPPSTGVANVVHQGMWHNLGRSIFAPVNQNRIRTTPGIVESTK